MEHFSKIFPWLQLWISPRKMLRTLLDTNPRYCFHRMLFFSGMGLVAAFNAMFSLPVLLVVLLLTSWPVGFIYNSVQGWILTYMGRIFNGQGRFEEVRIACLWSSFPITLGSIITFGINRYAFAQQNPPSPIYALIGMVALTASVWGFFTFIFMVAESHKISAWRAFFTIFLTSLIFVAVFMLITNIFQG